ncbi:MAG: hypothetical protein AAF389_05825 [Gemmatimonadota bacterium]
MVSNKVKQNALHRRALGLGLSASIAAHVAVLTIMTIPAPEVGAGDDEADRVTMVPFDGIELVELPEVVEQPVEAPEEVSTADAQGAVARETSDASPQLDELLSQMGQVSLTAAVPSTSRPVVTFADLEPVANTAAMMAQFAFEQGLIDDNDEASLEGLLGQLGASLSGGGHCPTPGTAGMGPLILR